MKTRTWVGVLSACGVLLNVTTTAFAQGAERSTLVRNFESGTLDGWIKVHDNLPTITTEHPRAGKYAMKSVLTANAPTTRTRARNEMRADKSFANIGEEYWYGFSVFLPDGYVSDSVWEIVAQWHVEPDDRVENDAKRQPALSLHTVKGNWTFASKSDARPQTPDRKSVQSHPTKIGPYETNKWTDWVVNVKWSYKEDGFIRAWKDGVEVMNVTGPNCYNDRKGPYFKMGIYKGWGNMRPDKVTTRTVYHDEFRMAGPEGSYEAVAPGGGKPKAALAASSKPR